MNIEVTGILERVRQEEWPTVWRIRVASVVPKSLEGLNGKRVDLVPVEKPLPWLEDGRNIVIEGRLTFVGENAQVAITPVRTRLASGHAERRRASRETERGGPDDR
jgi:hypothetical protein